MSNDPTIPPVDHYGERFPPPGAPSDLTFTLVKVSLVLNAIGCPFIVEALFNLAVGLQDHYPVIRVVILLALPLIAMLFASIAYRRIRKEQRNLTNAFLASLSTVVSIIWILAALVLWMRSYAS